MTTRENLKRLAELVLDAGKNYYERTKLAKEILDDSEWLESEFRGDAYNAAATLERQYFHDLSGSLTIWQLLEVLHKFPNESDWRSRKFNLRVLWKDTNVSIKPSYKVERITKAQHMAVVDTLKEKDFALKKVSKEKNELEQEVNTLRSRVVSLERENLRLKGRIEELERIVGNKLAG